MHVEIDWWKMPTQCDNCFPLFSCALKVWGGRTKWFQEQTLKDSCVNLSFVRISLMWVVDTRVLSWCPPPKREREGGPKRNGWLKKGFLNPSLPHPWCEKCHTNKYSDMKSRGIKMFEVWFVCLKLREASGNKAKKETPNTKDNVLTWIAKIVLRYFCIVLLKIVLSLRDSTHLILEQIQVNVSLGCV